MELNSCEFGQLGLTNERKYSNILRTGRACGCPIDAAELINNASSISQHICYLTQ